MTGAEIGIVTGSAEAEALVRHLPDARILRPGRVEGAALDGLRALVDGAHPFDHATHWQLHRMAEARGLPVVQLRRPGYRRQRGDHWTYLPNIRSAAQLIRADARVFATTGGEDLAALRRLKARLFIRRRAERPGPCPLRGAVYLGGAGPFGIAQEMRLMRRYRIDWLITRDAGGTGSYPKLAAARRLGIRVALIARPAAPPGPIARTAEEAMSWLTRAGS
ncbi:Precorrin-6A reductase [Roseivivax sp. THAF40]|uniref:precorrin-6A/cobalt-precorrin-6A reductase n=1 Tax=unclassified Roseivivax TaxID=2639302 RepID=UPI001268FEB8|nr:MULTISPECIES: precorrin-6A/cobalt-precorrin-6A reductase [unclassified Roseivivax]QFS82783.1 Precorrin-6A reductase [Roseivivax sp. THAF197b]QFT46552.1 Precorrin-6A reductase [Roseivivax sp. THAF40]